MAEPIPMINAVSARKIVRDLAQDSDNVIIVDHAQKRQKQRRITRAQILQCLRKGTVQEGPFVNSHGSWQVTMYRHAAGEELHCVAAIDWPSRVIVITAY